MPQLCFFCFVHRSIVSVDSFHRSSRFCCLYFSSRCWHRSLCLWPGLKYSISGLPNNLNQQLSTIIELTNWRIVAFTFGGRRVSISCVASHWMVVFWGNFILIKGKFTFFLKIFVLLHAEPTCIQRPSSYRFLRRHYLFFENTRKSVGKFTLSRILVD